MAQLLSSLPIGAKVKFGKYQVGSETPTAIKWTIVAKNHAGYPSNSITLHSTYAVDMRAIDARTYHPSPSTGYDSQGNNTYKLSNIDQWLNSDANAGEWYSPTEEYDSPPDSGSFTAYGESGTTTRLLNGGSYSHKAGFLNLFSEAEKSAILSTSVQCVRPYWQTNAITAPETIIRKVFLPSVTEVRGETSYGVEGTQWEGASYTIGTRYLTPEAAANTNCTNKPGTSSTVACWSRTPYVNLDNTGQDTPRWYTMYEDTNRTGVNAMYAYMPCISDRGIRPVINITSATLVSDTTDGDGYYTVFFNTVPSTPSYITVPATVYGGKAIPISWGESIDPDGNFGAYILERQSDGGSWVEIYRGTTPSFTDSFPLTPSLLTVAYRVRAYDIMTNSPYSFSEYTTSDTKDVVNNYPPVITVENDNLGVLSDEFVTRYKVIDANGTKPSVTIRLDENVIYTGTPPTEVNNDIVIASETWLGLNNGTHTITVTATDGIDTDEKNIRFTKSVNHILITNPIPLPSETQPGRIRVSVTREIPEGATFKVLVCNNGYDTNPTWEDMTREVESESVYVFTNNSKTATNWGIGIKVEVDRNDAIGECYISQIGGNFE